MRRFEERNEIIDKFCAPLDEEGKRIFAEAKLLQAKAFKDILTAESRYQELIINHVSHKQVSVLSQPSSNAFAGLQQEEVKAQLS
jgi:hypothetical protein